MPLLAIPNVSEGRHGDVIDALGDALRGAGGTVLDTHIDEVHNRTVFTVTGDLPDAMASLAEAAARHIDLTTHRGVHPRLGVLDVCPVVPHREPMEAAVRVAGDVGGEIARRARLPVYLYAEAARRPETRDLPDLRRGGLEALERRMAAGLTPDFGPARIDPAAGVACVGARRPLIAFNVWLRADLGTAREIAARVRSTGGGPPGVRALGLAIDKETVQVSMNLTDPVRTGIDDAFEVVRRAAAELGGRVSATEIVGVVEARFLPDPEKEAARLLMTPGRSVEQLLPP